MSVAKLLVANRGEIARRIMRTAHAMNIATVAVFSDADADAPHVAEADEAVALPGTVAADTYLRGDLIVEAARRTGADSVHPGYGFLSENAAFARACASAGLTFVGPSPGVIDLMGSKIEARRIMAKAGVPVLPGATIGDGDLEEIAREIGLPMLVKASFGGGGRGMRLVTDPEDLSTAVESAMREATAAFGDGTVFLERFVETPRHVEVQILGDHYGNVVHLYERECSIQRRHQKIIEESPSPGIDEVTRAELCAAAVSAGRAIGYSGAGTVEFVVAPDGSFWFLEVNTRLQVEHPVTELITGLDLVKLQLLVAQGDALPSDVGNIAPSGHAIEARLYAEDVVDGFRPTSGPIHRIRFSEPPAVRVDSGYVDGTIVSTHYDAMLAKVLAWAPTRTAAAQTLADVLARAQLHGPVTNRDLLVRTLRHPEFLGGHTDTGFLERNGIAELARPLSDAASTRIHAAVAALAARYRDAAASPLPSGIPKGWRNVGPADQPIVFVSENERFAVTCRVQRGRLQILVDDMTVEDAEVSSASEGVIEMTVGGVRRRYHVHRYDDVWYVDSALGASVFREEPRFPLPVAAVPPGSLTSPLPGTVVQLRVSEGDEVRAGDSFLTLEAMKMEHPIHAPEDGVVVAIHVHVGDQVDTGTLLAVIEPTSTTGG